jgi:hypothetical protein
VTDAEIGESATPSTAVAVVVPVSVAPTGPCPARWWR